MKRLTFLTLIENSADQAPRYWFIWNHHMRSPGFLGGQIDADDLNPRNALRRELGEELGEVEIEHRFGVQVPHAPSLAHELDRLVESASEHAVDSPWPIFSRRAQHAGQTPHQVRSVSHYRAEFDRQTYPCLADRLSELAEMAVVHDADSRICSAYSDAALAAAASTWTFNPWLGSALACGAIVLPPALLPWQSCALRTAEAIRAKLQRFADKAKVEGNFAVRILPGVYAADGVAAEGDAACLDIRHSHLVPPESTSGEPLLSQVISWSADGIYSYTNEEGKMTHSVVIHRMARRRGWVSSGDPQRQWLELPNYMNFAREPVLFTTLESQQVALAAGWETYARLLHELLANSCEPFDARRDDADLSFWVVETLSGRLLRAFDVLLAQLFLSVARHDEVTNKTKFPHTTTETGSWTRYAPELAADAQSRTALASREAIDSISQMLASEVPILPARFVQCFCRSAAADGVQLNIPSLRSQLIQFSPVNWLRSAAQCVQRIDPLVQAELASALYQVERFSFRAATMEQLPARSRQLHPSHRGILCPFETPESKRVGLTLHFATTARLDAHGVMSIDRSGDGERAVDSLERSPSTHLLPLIAHSDATRTSMCAKNVKQAVPIVGAQAPRLQSASADAAFAPLTVPLRRFPELPRDVGHNVVVAYMPWHGLNTDDAIVVSHRARDAFAWKQKRSEMFRIAPGWQMLRSAEHAAYLGNSLSALAAVHFDPAGCVRPGTVIDEASELAWFTHPPSGAVRALRMRDLASGSVISAIWQAPSEPWLGGSLTVEVEAHLPLLPGDKLMARYGNKGVIAQILPDDAMPRLPDDDSVPVTLRGRPVDVILNPLGVITRLNLGQVFETHLTWAQQGECADNSSAVRVGAALTEAEWQLIQRRPMVPLCLPAEMAQTGGENGAHSVAQRTRFAVTVGWQYFFRLKQSPSLKGNFRGKGPISGGGYAALTGQATKGRRAHGGQSFGEMELWAMMAHRATCLLADVIGPRSHEALGEDGASATWKSIVNHLRALGIAVNRSAIDGVTPQEGLSAIRYLPPKDTADEWPGDFLRGSTRWVCGRCSRVHELPGGATVAVLDTERDSAYASLDAVLLALEPSLRGPLSALPFADFCTGQIEGAHAYRVADGSALSCGWTVTLDNGRATGKTKARLRAINLSLTRGATLRSPAISLAFRYARPALNKKTDAPQKGWLAAFDWRCAEHPTDIAAKLQPRASEPWRDQVQHWISLPVDYVTERDRRYDPAIPDRIAVLPSAYRPTGRNGEPSSLTLAYRALQSIARQRQSEYRDRRIAWQLDVIQGMVAYRLFGSANHPALFGGGLFRCDVQEASDSRASGDGRRRLNRLRRHLAEAHQMPSRSPKLGLLRAAGLRRRVDWSGRFVIIPRPDLWPDQCAVPAAALAVLLAARIADWLPSAAALPALAELQVQLCEASHSVLSPEYWLNRKFTSTPAVIEGVSERRYQELCAMYGVICAYLAMHADILVLLNRQPSLHKHSMLSFRPICGHPAEGWVLGIHPLVCKGFNADFDGDEMSVHAVLGADQTREALRLLPTQPEQLVTVADPSKPLWECKQDFALGAFLDPVNSGVTDVEREFRALAAAALRADPDAVILHVQGIMARYRSAVSRASQSGVSINAMELYALAQSARELSVTEPPLVTERDAYQLNANNGVAAREILGRLQSTAPNLHALFVSSARGSVTQHGRQMFVSRGYLDPNELDDTGHLAQNRFERHYARSSLTQGLSADELFYSAFAGRSALVDKKLLTPKAGALTRMMMMAAWEWRIDGDDCGSPIDARSPLFCRQAETTGKRRVVCRACYGASTDAPTDNAPIGILAAQSIGERGTQLSMESYKGDGRRVRPEDVAHLLTRLTRLARTFQLAIDLKQRAAAVLEIMVKARHVSVPAGAMIEALRTALNNSATEPITEALVKDYALRWFVAALRSIDAYQTLAPWHIPLVARAVFENQPYGWLSQWVGGNSVYSREPRRAWRAHFAHEHAHSEPAKSWAAQLVTGQIPGPIIDETGAPTHHLTYGRATA